MRMKAMILAAGEGSRLLPLTQEQPKALVAFHGVPMLEILMRRLVGAGFKDIIINVFHFKEQIKQFVAENNGFGAEVVFSEEEQLLDTGGGIKNAIPYLGNEPVLYHNVDVLTNINLRNFYHDHLLWGGMASLATKERSTSRHLLQDKAGRIVGWQHAENRIRIVSRPNRRGYHETAFSGIYILNSDMLELFPEEDVFSLTPWIINLSGSHDLRGWDNEDYYWFDLGTAANLKTAEQKLIADPNDPASFILR